LQLLNFRLKIKSNNRLNENLKIEHRFCYVIENVI
jgi:hypothetical protein